MDPPRAVRFADDAGGAPGPATPSFPAAAGDATGSDAVVREFHEALARAPEMAVAVAAIKALTGVIKRSKASTMMGLERELKDAAATLERCNPTALSLRAGCELFLRFATRTSALEMADFAAAKAHIVDRGVHFAETSTRARATIADLGARFVRPGATVLTHGASRVVLALLRRAAARGAQFSVLVTEGRPDGTGLIMARALAELGVPVVAILDCGAAAALETRRVDFALVGAEAVVESGGAVNKLGTYGIAVACAAAGVPLYVAAESYKFARIYPLSQRSLPAERKHVDFGPLMPRGVEVDNPSRDYTPPKYISLLFTDLGVLTPAAVSDELIQLYS